MTKNQIIEALTDMDREELREINEALIRIDKAKRTATAAVLLTSFREGMEVRAVRGSGSGLPKGSTGKIVKVNRTRCKVDFGAFGIWNVPPTALAKMGAPVA